MVVVQARVAVEEQEVGLELRHPPVVRSEAVAASIVHRQWLRYPRRESNRRAGKPDSFSIWLDFERPDIFSGSRFGTGLAVGAVGGLAAGVIGSQIAHSVAAGSVGGFHDGRYYYYGDRNYPGAVSSIFMNSCSQKIKEYLRF